MYARTRTSLPLTQALRKAAGSMSLPRISGLRPRELWVPALAFFWRWGWRLEAWSNASRTRCSFSSARRVARSWSSAWIFSLQRLNSLAATFAPITDSWLLACNLEKASSAAEAVNPPGWCCGAEELCRADNCPRKPTRACLSLCATRASRASRTAACATSEEFVFLSGKGIF